MIQPPEGELQNSSGIGLRMLLQTSPKRALHLHHWLLALLTILLLCLGRCLSAAVFWILIAVVLGIALSGLTYSDWWQFDTTICASAEDNRGQRKQT